MLLKVLEQSPCCEVCSLYDPENMKSPALMQGRRLDASFCTRLTGPAMAAALAGAGRLQEVVLSACLGVDAVTVLALSMMQDLCSLDLSYTGIEVRELCRSLEALA